MPDHLLTFEMSADGEELTVHGDAKGLKLLANAVSRLATRAEAGASDHAHLATEAWGGTELSAERQSETSRLLNQITVRAWPSSRAKGA